MANKISAEEFFDDWSVKYDDLFKAPKSYVHYLNEAAKIFHQYNYHQGSILDIGCGTGLLSELLQGNFEYTGIDISSKILDYAAKRGYQTIHRSIEIALPEIDDNSYDFVFCLSSLLFIEDVKTAVENIYRVARQAILISLDETTEEYIKKLDVPVYNHSKITVKNTIEDYFISGFTSPTTGISIRTRLIYIEQKS